MTTSPKRVVQGLQGFLLQVDVAEIVIAIQTPSSASLMPAPPLDVRLTTLKRIPFGESGISLPKGSIVIRGVCVLTLALLMSASSFGQSGTAPLRVGIKGFDPVAYFSDKRPVKGAAELKYDWDETRYLFASAKHREMFSANPDRYVPQFGANCTTGASKGNKSEANPELWMIVDGKLYLFASPRAKEMAERDVAGTIARAKQNWPATK